MITINLVTDIAILQTVFQIRKIVFVEEQHVPEDEEYDEFEHTARHFLAFFDSIPCGTARWRWTQEGVKLERFAVLKEFRGKGIGHQLVEFVLADVKSNPAYSYQKVYLNSQLEAMNLYIKSGFAKVGDMFLECDIKHYKMVLGK